MKKIKVKAKVAEKEKVQLKIDTDFIRLDAALKLANIAVTGGQAKMIIGDGQIKTDGEVCTMRGKKLRSGDNFEFDRKIYEII